MTEENIHANCIPRKEFEIYKMKMVDKKDLEAKRRSSKIGIAVASIGAAVSLFPVGFWGYKAYEAYTAQSFDQSSFYDSLAMTLLIGGIGLLNGFFAYRNFKYVKESTKQIGNLEKEIEKLGRE